MKNSVIIGFSGVHRIGCTSVMRRAIELLGEKGQTKPIRMPKQEPFEVTLFEKSHVIVLGNYPFYMKEQDFDRRYPMNDNTQHAIEMYIKGLPELHTLWFESSWLFNDLFIGLVRANPRLTTLFFTVDARDSVKYDRLCKVHNSDLAEIKEKYDLCTVYNNIPSDLDVLGKFIIKSTEGMIKKILYPPSNNERAIKELGY